MPIINEDDLRGARGTKETPQEQGFQFAGTTGTLPAQHIHHALIPKYAKRANWEWVIEHYCRGNKKRLRNVTMMVMREELGMQMNHIGLLFGVHKGTVLRGITKARKELFALILKDIDEKDLTNDQ